MTNVANDNFALDVWHASRTSQIKGYAHALWGTMHGAEEGIQEVIVRALSKPSLYDETKGRLSTWLMLQLKSQRQRERSKGHRRGTVPEPRVVCMGDDTPDMIDLCDPELILMAQQIDVSAIIAADEAARSAKKSEGYRLMVPDALEPDTVRYIRDNPQIRNRDLVKMFNVSKTVISNVRNGKTYRGA